MLRNIKDVAMLKLKRVVVVKCVSKTFLFVCLSHIGEFKLKRVVVGVFQRLFSLLLVPHWGEMVHLIVYRLWVILLNGMR